MKNETPEAGEAKALWYVAPERAEIRSSPLRAAGPEEMRVRTLWSAISRGTERLVSQGLFDPIHRETMRAPMQEGDFPFPVKYGYCAVGVMETGPAERIGETVFCLHPHQDRFLAPLAMLTRVPDAVPARRAVLAANMETALNVLWDATAGPADRIVVVGAGVVGLLVAYLAARLPGAEVTVSDPLPERGPLVERLGAAFVRDLPAMDADVVVHTSGTDAGLAAAIAACGTEGTIVEASWYGDRVASVPLGGVFHSRRLRIVSSQVGRVAPARGERWTMRRRLAKALDLLADPRLDALVSEEVAFADLPAALPRILAAGAAGLAPVVRYD